MAGSDRAIGALKLFTLERPDWTVEGVAAALGVSASSAYRYIATLEDAGFVTTVSSGRYTLGPAFIEGDRQIQLTDPLLRSAQPVMSDMLRFAPSDSAILLCRLYRSTVLCVHQLTDSGQQQDLAYQRGRPMPLFRGATSKVILAGMSGRDLRRLFLHRGPEIGAAGLGGDWATFRDSMAQIRKAGYLVTRAELDHDRTGIAAPILDGTKRILGSLSYVVPGASQGIELRLAALTTAGAAEIEIAMRADAAGPCRKPD